MSKKIIFISSADLNDNRGGDNIYAGQVFFGLSKIPKIKKIEFLKIENKNIYIFIPFLPFMWRGLLSFRQVKSVYRKVRQADNDTVFVIDHFRCTWVVLLINSFLKKPKIFHVSQNIESDIMSLASKEKDYHFFYRLFCWLECFKLKFWERYIYKRSSIVSFITSEDRRLSGIGCDCEKSIILTPHLYRNDTEKFSVPEEGLESCLVIGSFYWNIKRKNLIALLDVFYNNNAGVDVIVAGGMPDDFFETLRRYPFVKVYRNFDSIDEFSGRCSLAIAPDNIGGGFKMKLLDYIDACLPIYALKGAVNGLPENNKGVNLFDDYTSMMNSVLNEYSNKKAFHSQQNAICDLKSNSFDVSSFHKKLLAVLDKI